MLCLQALLQEVSLVSRWKVVKLPECGIPHAQIEWQRLKVKGVQIRTVTTLRYCRFFRGLEKAATETPSPMVWRNPKLFDV